MRIYTPEQREQQRLYRLSRKEQKRAYDRAYWAYNKEALKERARRWRKQNKEYKAQKDKEWRMNNPERKKANGAAYFQKNKDKFRAVDLMRNYGMTIEQYDTMLESQGGVVDGSVVVLVSGKAGGVHLSHVEVLP